MRSRSGRPPRVGGPEPRLAPQNVPQVTWDDLAEPERTALKRLNRGPYSELPAATAQRLIALGLAVERPGGIGINRHGRELVITTLLDGQQKKERDP